MAMSHEDAETLYVNVRSLVQQPIGSGNHEWIPLAERSRLPAGPARDKIEAAFAILTPCRDWPRPPDYEARIKQAEALYREALALA